ncbi:hypothetical protein Y695_03832 [Hydrogenophaga sp. T4]|nr:hypothetical protein Y695_03832 [Hydrogenophaga sp. T4]
MRVALSSSSIPSSRSPAYQAIMPCLSRRLTDAGVSLVDILNVASAFWKLPSSNCARPITS